MDKIKSEKGFTLLEVIFSVSILTVGILAVASMQVASIRGNAFAWKTSEASIVAMGQIERLMDLTYNDAVLTAGDHTELNPPQGYAISWHVDPDLIINRTKSVRLTVSWTDHAVPKTVAMSFMLGQVL
jgi:prepilin-type N-terminal cleavage/methylation domain-containing protein